MTAESYETLTRDFQDLLRKRKLADSVSLIIIAGGNDCLDIYREDREQKISHYQDVCSGTGSRKSFIEREEKLVNVDDDGFSRFSTISGGSIYYPPFKHFCLLPFHAQGGLTGGCEIMRNDVQPFAPDEIGQLLSLMALLMLAVDRIRKNRATHLLQNQCDHYRTLVDITNLMLAQPGPEEFIIQVSDIMRDSLFLESVGVILTEKWEKESCIIRYPFGTGKYEKLSPGFSRPLARQLVGEWENRSIKIEKKHLLEEYSLLLHELDPEDEWLIHIIPLRIHHEEVGALYLIQREANFSKSRHFNLMQQIAQRMAIALHMFMVFPTSPVSVIDASCKKFAVRQPKIPENKAGMIIGQSKAMLSLFQQVKTVARSTTTVLIVGETGTGKELVAQALHSMSPRSAQPMVKMNCAVMPSGLLESDLFGHEKGAFTGAVAQRTGRFEQANNGTLFLDEVGEIAIELQPKLLRVLQEREFERVGGSRQLSVDVRLIAATNRNLRQMVEDREFRSDLYYRLNVFPLFVPPLRDRREDIPFLTQYLATKIARRINHPPVCIPEDVFRHLSSMPWPGNIRELENVIERSLLLSLGDTFQLHLPTEEVNNTMDIDPCCAPADEYQRILQVLKETNGVISGPHGAAVRLGLKRTTLLSRMKKMGISAR